MQPVSIDQYIEEQINLLVGFKIWWKMNSEQDAGAFPKELTFGEWDEQVRIFDEVLLDHVEGTKILTEAVTEYKNLSAYVVGVSERLLAHVQKEAATLDLLAKRILENK